jgi:XTP/dITP diphosphohydrolase
VRELLLATRNPGKLVEIRELLRDVDIAICALGDRAPDLEIEEDSETFEGNSRKKAVEACVATGLPALADDSGLVVEALDGRPGVRSARFGGSGLTDNQRCALLLEALAASGSENRAAYFQASVAYAEPGKEPVLFRGVLSGTISLETSGEKGFGYDPVFVPDGYTKTLAELGSETKNRISHRARALFDFRTWFLRQNR